MAVGAGVTVRHGPRQSPAFALTLNLARLAYNVGEVGHMSWLLSTLKPTTLEEVSELGRFKVQVGIK